MAYNRVSRCRFYINVPEWLASIGAVPLPEDDVDNKLLTLPVKLSDSYNIPLELRGMTDYGFVAVLGHNMSYINPNYNNVQGHYALESTTEDTIVMSEVVNGSPNADGWQYPQYDGFSITTFAGSDDINKFKLASATEQIGSVVIGTYYDMPHSPDLSLTLGYDYSGIDTIETKGGASLSNARWVKPPTWGDGGSWELYGSAASNLAYQPLAKSGRRVWDLSFSYLQDSDMFPMLSSLYPYESTSATGDVYSSDAGGGSTTTWHQGETLTDSNNFFSQVIHKTKAGQLPFIFNPAGGGNSPNNNPDSFAICKFDMNSFKFKQVANSAYNIKLKIREVW